ncbi:MAG: septation protein SepH [Microbacteriaceae bacterium]|nr:septation protein SepH [Microbacteriaceae bacterium]MCI1207267.1 septation protein SepH [Microbacteriaceae bacterium]
MQELRFVGVQDNALILTGENGLQARLPITEALRSGIRAAHTAEKPVTNAPRPRDIQALLRGGQTPQQVADHFDVDVDYIEKFQVPVMAELQHIVDLAQHVPLSYADDAESDITTFGDIILHRLVTRQATNTSWHSWKEQDGRWTVQVSYEATGSHHDARWFFEPRRQQLEPANEDASNLSTAQDLTPVDTTPRLHVVDAATTPETYARQTGEPLPTPEPIPERTPRHSQPAPAPTEVGPITLQRLTSVEPPATHEPSNNTEELLQALRRHRGERTSAPRHQAEAPAPSETAPDSGAPLDLFASSDTGQIPVPPSSSTEPSDPEALPPSRPRGRANMPSWDEIVFGTKPHPTDD